MGLQLLETATEHYTSTVPPWGMGLIAFGLLMLGLVLVRSLGHRRPHSK